MPAVPDRETYLARWSALHGGYDPHGSRLVRTWLGWMHAAARPLAATGVPPDAVTLLGLAVSAGAAGVAGLGDRWPVVGAALVVVAGVLDGLDGAVAVLADRASRWGYVLDSVVDRVGEGLFLVALWLAGAPGWLCVLAGALTGLLEYARARAAAAGLAGIGVVTAAERPTRVAVTAAFLLGAGVYVGAAAAWASAGAAAWALLGALALLHLLPKLKAALG